MFLDPLCYLKFYWVQFSAALRLIQFRVVQSQGGCSPIQFYEVKLSATHGLIEFCEVQFSVTSCLIQFYEVQSPGACSPIKFYAVKISATSSLPQFYEVAIVRHLQPHPIL